MYKRGSKGDNDCPEGYAHITTTNVQAGFQGRQRLPGRLRPHHDHQCTSGVPRATTTARKATPTSRPPMYKRGSKGDNDCPEGYAHLTTTNVQAGFQGRQRLPGRL